MGSEYNIGALVTAAKNILKEKAKPLSGEILFHLITSDSPGCYDFLLFKRALKKEPQIGSKVVFRKVDCRVYTEFWTKSRKDLLEDMYARYEEGETIIDLVNHAQDKLEVNFNYSTTKDVLINAKRYWDSNNSAREILDIVRGEPASVTEAASYGRTIKLVKKQNVSEELERIIKKLQNKEQVFDVSHIDLHKASIEEKAKVFIDIGKLLNIYKSALTYEHFYDWLNDSLGISYATFMGWVRKAKQLARQAK